MKKKNVLKCDPTVNLALLQVCPELNMKIVTKKNLKSSNLVKLFPFKY